MTDEYAKLEEEDLQKRKANSEVYSSYGKHTVVVDITHYNTIEQFRRLGEELYFSKKRTLDSLEKSFKALQ